MISRRRFLRSSATAAISAGGTCMIQVPFAAAAAPDPFLAFIADWQAADERFDNLAWPMPDEDASAAYDAILLPFNRRCAHADLPPATTAEGAAAALRKILEWGWIHDQPQDANLLRVALSFLEGKASS